MDKRLRKIRVIIIKMDERFRKIRKIKEVDYKLVRDIT
jgi:hypothetical protein